VTRLLCTFAAVGLVALLAGCGEEGLGRASQLVVVDVESGERRQFTGSYSSPSWSPDSRRLAVVASGPESGAIEVVDVEASEGRAVVRRRGFIQGVAWSPRGETLAYVRLREPDDWTLETIGAAGWGRRTLATHRSNRVAGAWPSWAPDGRRIAFTAGADTFVVRRTGAPPRLLLADAWAPRWSPDGRSVLLATRDALVAVPVDRSRAMTIVDGLIDAHAAWSPGGDEVAFSGVTAAGDRRYHLYRVPTASGRVVRIASESAADAPAWSPDGRSLAFATWEGEVRVVTLATGETRTLTRLHHTEVRDLAWSPDGRRLAFVARWVTEG
jgi:Tol biopolymer transport system component